VIALLLNNICPLKSLAIWRYESAPKGVSGRLLGVKIHWVFMEIWIFSCFEDICVMWHNCDLGLWGDKIVNNSSPRVIKIVKIFKRSRKYMPIMS
jgi:hypothetical protein